MIKDILNRRLTGNVFIVCANNKSAQLSIKGGQVVGIRCGAFYAEKAVDELVNTGFSSARFVESGHLVASEVPASIERVLSILENTNINKPQVSQSSTPEYEVQGIDNFADEVKAVFTEYLGPVAGFIFDDTKENILSSDRLTSSQLTQFVLHLASNITDATDSAKFVTAANRIVDKYTKK